MDTWGGFIFVHPDPVGESLRDYLALIPDYFRETHLPWEELRQVLRWTYDEPFNWKLILENFIEEYHLPYLHPQTLSMMDKQTNSPTFTGNHIKFHVTFVEPSRKETSVWKKWDTLWDVDGVYQVHIFPNLLILAEKDYVVCWWLTPINPGRTIIEMFFYQTPAQAEKYPLGDDWHSWWRQNLGEDFATCRLLQQAVNSRAYKVTQLADKLEAGITHFHKVYLAAMNTDQEA